MAISQLMQDDHRRCDAAFVGAEEELLFPAFEQATGMSQGPTRTMCHEHGQMRDLLSQMEAAATGENAEEFTGASETLLVLMQQRLSRSGSRS